MNPSPEQLAREREQRVADAIALKIPDRVPVISAMGYFPAHYAGITFEAAYYDYEAWLEAYRKTLRVLQPDMMFVQGFTPGTALEMLDPYTMKWPGHGIPSMHSHQAIELEYLKADEWDVFMNNTADYMIRYQLPRVCGAAKGLEALPDLSRIGYTQFGMMNLAVSLADPEVSEAIDRMREAGRELLKWRTKQLAFSREIEAMGFPTSNQGFALTPYDAISHSIRGMHGTMMDCYRQPDRLIAACDKLLEETTGRPPLPKNKYGNDPRIFIPLTRGSDDFMSLEHFERFYWPTLRKLVGWMIENGETPVLFFEGNFLSRLEYFLEFPKGRILAQLDSTDIFKAKEIFRDHICIQGNVPSSLLQTGTPDDVRAYCRKLIDGIGRDGGFILSPRSSTDYARLENIQAMIEFTKEYGMYN